MYRNNAHRITIAAVYDVHGIDDDNDDDVDDAMTMSTTSTSVYKGDTLQCIEKNGYSDLASPSSHNNACYIYICISRPSSMANERLKEALR